MKGLESTILTLEWPSEVGPAELSNFESAARRLRYQALGKACRDKRISSLLLAHHNDDQAETVLLRLVRGQGGAGLKCIQSSAEIPDCWGQHGVHQSGFFEDEFLSRPINDIDSSRKEQEEGRSVLDDRQEKTKPTIYFEDGGVRIYRPLLKFSKDRLQSTCYHYRVPWVEDETNQDASRTPRNAVRQLLNSGKLPKALQKTSLLAVAERAQERSANRIQHAKELFDRSQIPMFDQRTGMLVVRMPARAVPIERISEAVFEGELKNYRFEASLFLRSLLEIVSPKEKISLQRLEFALCSIFPDLDDPEATALDKRLSPSIFTTQGVQFQRCLSPIERKDSGHVENPEDLDPEFIWVLTRQPDWLLRYPTPPSPLILIPPAPNNSLSCPSNAFSPWHLFDGRFWIRLSHSSPLPLEIRLPKPADMAALRESFRGTPQRPYVESRWRSAAPGKIRFTLPIIAEAGEAGRVLALPTLDIDAPGVKRELRLRWEVRYKKVDWRGRWVKMAEEAKDFGKQRFGVRFSELDGRTENRNSWEESLEKRGEVSSGQERRVQYLPS